MLVCVVTNYDLVAVELHFGCQHLMIKVNIMCPTLASMHPSVMSVVQELFLSYMLLKDKQIMFVLLWE